MHRYPLALDMLLYWPAMLSVHLSPGRASPRNIMPAMAFTVAPASTTLVDLKTLEGSPGISKLEAVP